MTLRPLLLLIAAAPLCAAHGSMNKPPSWLDPFGFGTWWANRCAMGCTGGDIAAQGCICEWYSNYTHIPNEPTIPPGSPLMTYKDACMDGLGTEACCNAPCTDPAMQAKGQQCEGCDWSRTHPWRAPGTAPVFSPCGFDGGNPHGCPVGNPKQEGCGGGGYGHGPDGRSLKGNVKPEVWTAGGEAEVVWGVTANHGGGYQYRLCPKPENNMDLTEECFQKTPLRFVGTTQWLQNGSDMSTRVAISAMRTDSGTFPAGSQWTRVPIPACGDFGGGSSDETKCNGTQFPPPVAGLTSFNSPWSIIDKVHVPDIPGDYVIGFRYDCEQTAQVWQQCGDVRIVSGPAPAPGPTDQCSNPLCQACCTGGVCEGCKACLTNKGKPGEPGCDGCWKASVNNGSYAPPCNLRGTSCLSDDELSCQACWSPSPLPLAWKVAASLKKLSAVPAECESCFTGGCKGCKGWCETHKDGACANCWTGASGAPPCNLRGTQCLADDGLGCEACWKLQDDLALVV